MVKLVIELLAYLVGVLLAVLLFRWSWNFAVVSAVDCAARISFLQAAVLMFWIGLFLIPRKRGEK